MIEGTGPEVSPLRHVIGVFVVSVALAFALDAPARPAVAQSARPVDATAPSAQPFDASCATTAAGVAGCTLVMPGSDATPSSECLLCHVPLAYGGHAFDVDYARTAFAGAGGTLRPIAEVLRRGVFLPERQLRCVTCHAGTSPWKFHIRLPSGATPMHAVDRRRPLTYENPSTLPAVRAGDDVGRKPLCLGCHARD